MTKREEKLWLESDSEDDDDDDEDNKKLPPCDHKPIQSELYYDNKEMLKNAQTWIGGMVLFLILLMIFLSSWIGLEEGQFPYNVDFMADIAYSKYRFGTPVMALFITFVLGAILLQVRRFLIEITSTKCYEKVSEHLEANGKLRKIKPKPPKTKRISLTKNEKTLTS